VQYFQTIRDCCAGVTPMNLISFSVGRGGVNMPADVAAVQDALDALAGQCHPRSMFTLPGQMDLMTQFRIAAFQGRYVPGQPADGLIRPFSMAENILMMASNPAKTTKTGMVTYASDIPAASQIVDPYSIAVIEKALRTAKMTAAKITSTIRLAPEQAAIMYRNAAVNLTKQYAMYGATGDAVLDVYKANQAKPKAEVVKLMTAKIEELYAKGRAVSNHLSTPEKYKSLNIIDIGVNSTAAVAGKSFNKTGLTKAFRALETAGYIRKFIDETAKSNNCWHLEIVPNAKKL
jgi:hypothetical protein